MPESAPRLTAPDLATLIALAAVAAAAATVLHEAVGHGGACWLSGGQNLVISSVAENCTVANPWIDAAGTLANLTAGAGFLLWSRRVTRSAHLRYLLWLSMAFNWLDAAGYWLFSGVGNIGDWAAILAGHHPAWLWHTGMALCGAAAYIFVVFLAARELKPFLPLGLSERIRCARRLMLVPYVSFGILACLAAVLNPGGALLIAESAAASSFGGASGLCWGWQFVRGPYFAQAGTAAPLPPLNRSRAALGWGVVSAALFVFFLGRGIR